MAPSGGGERSNYQLILSEQVEAVRRALDPATVAVNADGLAKQFQRADKKRVAEILETLVALGQTSQTDNGRSKG